MSTVPPPLPPGPGGAPSAPGPAVVTVTVSLPRAPAQVAALPPDAVLEARVLQAAVRAGQPVVLDTPLGPVTARASLPLPQGATLTLQLQSMTADQAVLRGPVAVLRGPVAARADGPAAALPTGARGGGALAPGGAGGQAGAATTGAGARAAADPVSVAGRAEAGARGLLTATVVRGAGPPSAPAGAGPQAGGTLAGAGTGPETAADRLLPTGTRLTVRLVSLQAPGGSGTGSGAPTPPGGAGAPQAAPSPSPAPAADSASGPASRPARMTTPGRAFGGPSPGAPVAAVGAGPTGPNPATGLGPAAPTGAAASASASVGTGTAPPATLTGTLQAGGPVGQSLLTTPAGTLSLPIRMEAPPGTQVILSVMSRTPPSPAPAASGIAPTAPPGAGVPQGGPGGWPAFTETVETLSRADPAAGRVLDASLPRPGPQLAFAMAGMAGALRAGGDLRQWPGDGTLRALDRMGPGGARLAGALRRDLADLAGRVRESPGGEWRAMTLPFADQSEISPIAVVVRVPGGRGDAGDDEARDGDGDAEGGGDPGQRFLVDVTLSHIGRMQIDGLMQARARRLQIILRTDRPLPPAMCRDLQALAADSLAALGLDGALSFRSGDAFLDPVPAPPPAGTPPPPPGGVIA
jgi:hypothetical protein